MSWVHNRGVWQAEQLSVYGIVQLPVHPKVSTVRAALVQSQYQAQMTGGLLMH